nr:unnamed protein product [Callosobruchus chinensis]
MKIHRISPDDIKYGEPIPTETSLLTLQRAYTTAIDTLFRYYTYHLLFRNLWEFHITDSSYEKRTYRVCLYLSSSVSSHGLIDVNKPVPGWSE